MLKYSLKRNYFLLISINLIRFFKESVIMANLNFEEYFNEGIGDEKDLQEIFEEIVHEVSINIEQS